VLSPSAVVDATLFSSAAERAMLAVLEKLEPIAAAVPVPYGELARQLAGSASTLAAFFDGEQSVLVMAEDPVVRRNRLNLLAVLRNQASRLADFDRISGS
jgi:glycyl-tRNA synthetase beta chain